MHATGQIAKSRQCPTTNAPENCYAGGQALSLFPSSWNLRRRLPASLAGSSESEDESDINETINDINSLIFISLFPYG